MSRLRTTSLALALACASAPDLLAHGGQYRGPGDVVPPNPGGGRGSASGNGPADPSPGVPGAPGATTPITPDSGGPGTGRFGGPPLGGANPGTGGATALTDDLTRWSFWWELNKDAFLRLKDVVHRGGVITEDEIDYLGAKRRDSTPETLKPTRTAIRDILPALKLALESTTNRDITSSCMVALAKIGEDHPDFTLRPLFEANLKSKDQEIRETAALALGISQMPDALPTLVQLAKDSAQGRSLTDRSEVDVRTRAFSCYGIGLIAHASSSIDLQRAAFVAMADVLAASHDRNLKVAAINGIRLIRPNSTAGDAANALRDAMLNLLWSYYLRDLGQGEQQIQAHVPTAIATILGRGSALAGPYQARFAGELEERFGKRHVNIYQSAALALGQLCTTDPQDQLYSRLLDEYASKGRDLQARYFSVMALADIGGNDNRNLILQRLDSGRDQMKSWAALALGVLAFRSRAGNSTVAVDSTIGHALRQVLRNEKNDEVLAAAAIALGLTRYTDAAPDLRQMLERYKRRDEFGGYLAVSLGLMGDMAAKEPIRALAAGAIRRPDLLRQAAIALGLLSDKQVAKDLTEMLMAGDKNVARLSAVAAALGLIGDRRTIAPLKAMLFDPSITDLSRAFAAVALGNVADKEALPWNAKIAAGLNYRAAVETLTNQSSGILDIL